MTQIPIRQLIAIGAVGALGYAAFRIAEPFLLSLTWAAIITFSTWEIFAVLRNRIGKAGAAALMVALLLAVMAIPMMFVASNLSSLIDQIHPQLESLHRLAVELADFVRSVPWIGPPIYRFLDSVIAGDQGAVSQLQRAVESLPARAWIGSAAGALTRSLWVVLFSLVLAFFLYLDGERISAFLQRLFGTLFGETGLTVLAAARTMTAGVVRALLATAFAQGVLMFVGLEIAGVPGASLLGFLTFFLSVIPIGPPLVWIPAGVWLFLHHAVGYAIFLAAWGLVVVAGADSVIKPYLISKGNRQPVVVTLIGVLGGAMAFGIIGLFVGPVILAVGQVFLDELLSVGAQEDAPSSPADAGPQSPEGSGSG
ncbi:uncharacterized protein E1O_09850 [Burkholderiales bacterium GJ-E10]|nr:uncharacterized protein E1O_09850 [Burkholderiales bacterium GJ-E10]